MAKTGATATRRCRRLGAAAATSVLLAALLLVGSCVSASASIAPPRRSLLQREEVDGVASSAVAGAEAPTVAEAPAVAAVAPKAAAAAPAPAPALAAAAKDSSSLPPAAAPNSNDNNNGNFFSTPAAVRDVQDSVVTVSALRSIALEGDGRGQATTDGFIVHSGDDGRVVVATDHVGSAVRASPATYTISFADGASVKAKALYYDPVQDFAFLQFSAADAGASDSSSSATSASDSSSSSSSRAFKALRLGTGRNLTVGQPLVLIGEQSGVYTRRDGVVSEPRVVSKDVGGAAGSRVRTTFERVDAMSGAPVFDLSGTVVALHSGSADSYSKELPIDYVTTALKSLLGGREGEKEKEKESGKEKASDDKKKKADNKKPSSSPAPSPFPSPSALKNQPKRGDLGVELTLLPAGVARRNYRLPADAVPAASSDGGAPQVIQVVALQSAVADRAVSSGGKEQSPAGGLQPGDIISKADGKAVQDDLFLLDRVLDDHVNGAVALQVWRNGTEKRLRVPVRDLEAGKLRRFARFGGGVFHELSEESRAKLQSAGAAEGVLMTYADRGTPMARLTAVPAASTSRSSQANQKLDDGSGQMLITEINGKKISSLDDFAAAARAVAPGSAGYVVARDLTSASSPIGGKVSELTFNVARYPLQLFAWDQSKLDWVVVEGGRKSGGGEKKGGHAAAADAVAGGDGGSGAGVAQAASDSSEATAPAEREAAVSSASASSKSGGGGKPGGRSLLQQNASSSSSGTSSSSSSSTNKPAAAADANSGGSAPIDAPKPAVGPGSANAEGGSGAAGGGAAGGLGGGGSGSGGRAAGGASSASSVPSSPRAASNVWSPEDRARLKRGVVSVRASTDIPLGNAVRADASSSGFIAAEDDGRLIVVTDARADNSPTDYTVFFHDGSSAKARPLFSDYATFLEVDRKDAPAQVEVLPVGSGLKDVPVGSRLLLVAASEDGTASDQEGTLLVRNSQLQTNINVARNSKAAPVLDSRGKVVAVHASNSDAGTLSFETPADYIKAQLDALKAQPSSKNKRAGNSTSAPLPPPPSSLVGISFEPISVGIAAKHYGLPQSAVDAVREGYDKGGVPSVTQLSQVPAYSAAAGVLERGDIVFAVNGTLLRDDSALFSLAADRAVAANSSLPVTLYRHGQRLELDVPVRDANAEKITRFARFAGGVLHDLKGLPRWKYGGGGNVAVDDGGSGKRSVNNGTGLFLSYAAPGSSWSALASSSGADSDLTKRLILSVNGRDTQAGGLDEFIKAAKEIKDGDEGFVVARNPLAVSRPAGVASKVAFNTRYDPLEVFEWDERSKEWKQVKV